jgi:CubicO group peptidase (beta-lactamase class C family)
MAELGIDDVPPLTDVEKNATIRHCLMARSGVYNPAVAESQVMKAFRPTRGTYQPGEYWFYNNWDFNVLGAIFEQQTGQGIFEALKEDIADRIQMEDFSTEDGTYMRSDESMFPAYHFQMTPHDMARFGLLLLREGQWRDNEIIPGSWVKQITTYSSDASLFGVDGYGYMWWVAKDGNKFPHLPFVHLPEGSFSARGAYGQMILVIPKYDLVIVHCVNTLKKGNSVSTGAIGLLVRKILEAMRVERPLDVSFEPSQYCGEYQLRRGVTLTVVSEGSRMFVQRTGMAREEAFAESLDTFYLAKNSIKLSFVRGSDNRVGEVIVHQLSRETRATKI